MPIIRARYNPGFARLARQLKEQANWRCEFCGLSCRKTGESWVAFFDRVGWAFSFEGPLNRYTLTTAHLDQDPCNDDPANVKALCTFCHLEHDRPYKTSNAYAKREWLGQGNLFWLAETTPLKSRGLRGVQLPLAEPLEKPQRKP